MFLGRPTGAVTILPVLPFMRVTPQLTIQSSTLCSFLEHIQLGVKEAAADPDALLLFSGGKTRK